MDISNASTGMVGRPFQVAALPALMDQDFIVSDPCIRLAIGMVEGRPMPPSPEILLYAFFTACPLTSYVR